MSVLSADRFKDTRSAVGAPGAPRGARRSATYRPDVDGLRAVAILSVLGFHAFPTVVRGGLIGVDVFFVISGFLISTIILDRLSKNGFSFAEFYSRRIRRIFPAVLLLLVAVLIFGWFRLLSDEYRDLGKNAAASAGFVSNLMLWIDSSNYFGPIAEQNVLLHLWSLGIEEQFYLLWPLLLWVLWKSRVGLLWGVVVVVVVSFCLNVIYAERNPIATFYSPHTRFWELSIGAALAATPHVSSAFAKKLDRVLPDIRSVVGAILILMGLLLITKERTFPGWWALLPTIGAALIISAGADAWLNSRILSHRVLVWIGLISFPLYLWHWPVLCLVRIAGTDLTLPVRSGALLLSVVLAWATFVLVEKPLRFGGRARLKTIVLVQLMCVVGYFGYSCYQRDGFGEPATPRLSAGNLDYVEDRDAFNAYLRHQDFQSTKCIKAVGGEQIPLCLISENYEPSVALIGDSHALAIFDFIQHQMASAGRGVILLGQGGCPPMLGVERDDQKCPVAMSKAVDFIVRSQSVEDVIITGRFAAAMSGRVIDGKTPPGFYQLKLEGHPEIGDRGSIFAIGLKSIVEALVRSGKRVTILLDLPELDFNPKRCLDDRGKHSCTIARAMVAERQSAYTELVRWMQDLYGYRVVDLKDAFCGPSICFAKNGSHVLYADSHHLGINGNIFLIKSGFRVL